jgi:hypothetical protein
MPNQVAHHCLCHCADCRRHSGAPAVGWALVSAADVEIKGTPKLYASSEHGRRHFCPDCGSGLFYSNEQIFPGMIDVQSATLDDPNALEMQAQIQVAERLHYMENLGDLPSFERYPSPD